MHKVYQRNSKPESNGITESKPLFFKNLPTFGILFYIALFFSFNGFAQRIINFNLFVVKNAVNIKFTISSGTSCNGYRIMYSSDSLVYVPVSEDGGICGGSGINEEKSYTHPNPVLNQTNYYKVEVLQPFETTPVKRVYVSEQLNASMLAFPNPVLQNNTILNLRILNTNNIRVIGFLYNQSGSPLRELDLTTKTDLAGIDVAGLENGMYVIWLTDGYVPYRTKFIVHR